MHLPEVRLLDDPDPDLERDDQAGETGDRSPTRIERLVGCAKWVPTAAVHRARVDADEQQLSLGPTRSSTSQPRNVSSSARVNRMPAILP
jgi:hypothetical protein